MNGVRKKSLVRDKMNFARRKIFILQIWWVVHHLFLFQVYCATDVLYIILRRTCIVLIIYEKIYEIFFYNRSYHLINRIQVNLFFQFIFSNTLTFNKFCYTYLYECICSCTVVSYVIWRLQNNDFTQSRRFVWKILNCALL